MKKSISALENVDLIYGLILSIAGKLSSASIRLFVVAVVFFFCVFFFCFCFFFVCFLSELLSKYTQGFIARVSNILDQDQT